MRTARATSAGGVVHRTATEQRSSSPTRRPSLWALPKGTPDSGETLEETALRETPEETGLRVEIEARIGSIRYVFIRGTTRYLKTVHFYLMRAVGGDRRTTIPSSTRRAGCPEEALDLLSHPTERCVVEQAEALSVAASQPSRATRP